MRCGVLWLFLFFLLVALVSSGNAVLEPVIFDKNETVTMTMQEPTVPMFLLEENP